jgi:hypothetical protein
MSKSKKAVAAICSMSDFHKQFYPKANQKIKLETVDDPSVVGTTLAERSLRRVKLQLVKGK